MKAVPESQLVIFKNSDVIHERSGGYPDEFDHITKEKLALEPYTHRHSSKWFLVIGWDLAADAVLFKINGVPHKDLEQQEKEVKICMNKVINSAAYKDRKSIFFLFYDNR